MIKLKLFFIYYKSLLWQYLNRKGAFPYKDYIFLINFLKNKNIYKVLEIGTGLGISSICFLNKRDIILTTIEKNIDLINLAKDNILFVFKDNNILNRINFINKRYFDYLENNNDKFDLIFLDAYISRLNEVKFLENFLNPKGFFIVSNLRENIEKSKIAKDYLLQNKGYKVLFERDDTIFLEKIL